MHSNGRKRTDRKHRKLIEKEIQAMEQREGDKMDSGNKLGLELNENLEVESASASISPETPHNSPDTDNAEYQSPLVLAMDLPRATDLLMSVSVRAEVNNPKITNLAMAAIEELTQLALEQEALWLLDMDAGTYVLNDAEYKRRFGPLDPTLEEILRVLKTEGPIELQNLNDTVEVLPTEVGPKFFQAEASQETSLVFRNPPKLVDMFMDLDQWTMVFSDIVSKAKVLGVLSMGEQGNLDGALQVMTAEFHLPSPLVQTRECYFLRHCRQLSCHTWVVVDVSLERVFPNPATRFVRRPSGCIIQGMGNGYSQVKWIEHIEVDNTMVHNLFRPLVTSGFAFSAKRWVGTLARQCDRAAAFMDDRVMIMQGGKKSLLKLADRMMRSYYVGVNASPENIWRPIPAAGAEDILVTTRYNIDDPGTPLGVSIAVVTTIWLPAQPKIVFDFLRNGNNRNQWDLLCLNRRTQEIARVTTGRDPANCVSLVLVDTSPLVFYLQESTTSSTGSFVVYAPLEILAVNSVLGGENPDDIRIFSSGFAVLPDRPTMNGEEIGGSLLTIAFQIGDKYAETPDYLPPKAVVTLYSVISETASMIRAAVIQ